MRVEPGPNARTLDLIGYRQVRTYTCGYAATLMVVRYFQPNAPARALYEVLGTSRDGTRQNAIIRALRARSVSVHIRYDMKLDDYANAIDRGKLVIAYVHDIEHWVVVYGYARKPYGMVFVADSRAGVCNVQRWRDYAERLRGFGMSCSGRIHTPLSVCSTESARDVGSAQMTFDFGAQRGRCMDPLDAGVSEIVVNA